MDLTSVILVPPSPNGCGVRRQPRAGEAPRR